MTERSSGSRSSAVRIRPVTRADWPAIVDLFGEKGACGGCWCMWWRLPGGTLWKDVQGRRNRESLQRLISTGKIHALMAFSKGGEPVGWCSFGPRGTFPRLQRARTLRTDWSEDTWSIVCFYIHPRWRSQKVASRLLRAATARAFALGAREVEGYPVIPKRPPARIPAAFAYTGVPEMFRAAGYTERGRPTAARAVCVAIKPANVPLDDSH